MHSKMKKLILLLLCSIFLVALGFNTIDWMVNTFYWQPPNYSSGLWFMSSWFKWDFWNCYIVFGILPLALGWLLIGFILGTFWHVRAVGWLIDIHSKKAASKRVVPAKRKKTGMSLSMIAASIIIAALFIVTLIYVSIHVTL